MCILESIHEFCQCFLFETSYNQNVNSEIEIKSLNELENKIKKLLENASKILIDSINKGIVSSNNNNYDITLKNKIIKNTNDTIVDPFTVSNVETKDDGLNVDQYGAPQGILNPIKYSVFSNVHGTAQS